MFASFSFISKVKRYSKSVIDRTYYKTRLEVFFKHYASKNFEGRPWSDLSEVILVRKEGGYLPCQERNVNARIGSRCAE